MISVGAGEGASETLPVVVVGERQHPTRGFAEREPPESYRKPIINIPPPIIRFPPQVVHSGRRHHLRTGPAGFTGTPFSKQPMAYWRFTAYSAQLKAYSRQHRVHSIRYTAHSTQYTGHSARQSVEIGAEGYGTACICFIFFVQYHHCKMVLSLLVHGLASSFCFMAFACVGRLRRPAVGHFSGVALMELMLADLFYSIGSESYDWPYSLEFALAEVLTYMRRTRR